MSRSRDISKLDFSWSSNGVSSVAGKTGAVTLVKSDVGLSNVDNTSDANKPVSTATQTALDAKLGITGGTMTGAITSLRESRVAMAANDINLSLGNFFTRTISSSTTLTISNVPASGQAIAFILELTNGGSAAVTWFTGVKWAGGTAPTLTASGRDVLGFYSDDAGVNWTGMMLARDAK